MFLHQIPGQPYYNQNLGPFWGNPSPIQFFGNGPPTAAPQQTAPAPLGPTPECPCMTTPSPNTTPAPGSPEDAKKEMEENIDELSEEKRKEAVAAAEKAGAKEVDSVAGLSKDAKDEARAKLSHVSDKELDKVMSSLHAEADRDELKMDALRAKAKNEGTADAEAVTQATEDIADGKARTVIGNVMAGTKKEISASKKRLHETHEKARGMVHEATLSAERVENAALEAKMAAMKEPRALVADAARQSIKAGEAVLKLQPEALQSQKMAEAAAAVAWEAQKTSNKALADAKAAIKASQSAYDDAMTNKANLVKLKLRAKEAEKEVKVAVTSSVNAQQQATGAGYDIKAYEAHVHSAL